MFNARKLGEVIAKFDKKIYEFEKRKQMIEESRAKNRENFKDRGKATKEKEINPNSSTMDKSPFQIHSVDADTNHRYGKSINSSLLKIEFNEFETHEDYETKDVSEKSYQTQNNKDKNLMRTLSKGKLTSGNGNNFESSKNASFELPKSPRSILKQSLSDKSISPRSKKTFKEQFMYSSTVPYNRQSLYPTVGTIDEENLNESQDKEFTSFKNIPKISPQNHLNRSARNKSDITGISLRGLSFDRKDLLGLTKCHSCKPSHIATHKKLKEAKEKSSNNSYLSQSFQNQKFFSVCTVVNTNKTASPEISKRTRTETSPYLRKNFTEAKTVRFVSKNREKGKQTPSEIAVKKQPINEKEKNLTTKTSQKRFDKIVMNNVEKISPNIKNKQSDKNKINNSSKRAQILPVREKSFEIPRVELSERSYNLGVDNTIIFNIINSKPEFEEISTTHSPNVKFNQMSNLVNNTISTVRDDSPTNMNHSKIENNNLDIDEDVYNRFLYESTSKRDSLQSLLKDQMKSIIYNMKDRKKEVKNVKVDKKKLILHNLSLINDSILKDDTNKNEKSRIYENIENKINDELFKKDDTKKEFQTNDLTNIMEDLILQKNKSKEEKKESNLSVMIKKLQNNFPKNENENEAEIENQHIKPNSKEKLSTSSIKQDNNCTNKFNDISKEKKTQDVNNNIDTEVFDSLDNHNENKDYIKDKTFQRKINNNVNIKGQDKVTKASITGGEISINSSNRHWEILMYGDYENPIE